MTRLAEEQRAALRTALACRNCGRAYPEQSFPHRCPTCGGLYGFTQWPAYQAAATITGGRRGIERYRQVFPLADSAPFVSLGEGRTPLEAMDYRGRRIYLKCEHLNPTGSFKDRGTAVLVSSFAAEGVQSAVEDSSGNAGASFAAYCARAGMQARVFVPDYAAGPKRAQIEAYGAELLRILGPRSRTSEAVERAAADGQVYASHAYLPHGLAGLATVAFELSEQLGELPSAVIAPLGQGTLLLGIYYGMRSLAQHAGKMEIPALVGVQAQACAPLWAVLAGGASQLLWTQEGETIAEGIRIVNPLRGDEVLHAITESGGWIEAVSEDQIMAGLRALQERGFSIEPTSAVVWPVLEAAIDRLPDPVVVVLTGSGLKSPDGLAEAASRAARS